jgi:hypothetical protein
LTNHLEVEQLDDPVENEEENRKNAQRDAGAIGQFAWHICLLTDTSNGRAVDRQ